MMQDRTGIVGLTTPKGEKKQFFKHLMRAKDKEGNPIFLKLQNKEACDACIELNRQDTCPHEVYSRSTNKTAKSMEKARLVYGEEYATAGNEELLGMDTSERGSIIPSKDIEAFQSNVIKMDKPPRCVYLSIDPGGGGKNSEMGIIIAAEVVGPYGVKIAVSYFFSYFTVSETFFTRLAPLPLPVDFLFCVLRVSFSAIVQTLFNSSTRGMVCSSQARRSVS